MVIICRSVANINRKCAWSIAAIIQIICIQCLGVCVCAYEKE